MYFIRFIITASSLMLALISNVAAQESDPLKPLLAECPIPTYSQLPRPSNVDEEQAITILSTNTNIEKNNLAQFSGGVTLMNKMETVKADRVEINQETSSIKATGNIHFQNKGIDIFASELEASELSKATKLSDTSYQLVNNTGHGSAKSIAINAEGNLIMKSSTFTTCYGDTPDWSMKASEITLSAKNKNLEAYNARFKIFNVPVLYLPYFAIPVGKERQSGFLYPSLKSSSNTGFEMKLPYYWNIAENMDATFTPRLMSKRGPQLLTEFRYLTGEQYGKLDLEYLHKDDELKANDDPRYLARLQHIGTFSDRFRAYVDYTTISDDAYLVDLGSSQYNSNDAYLYQIGEIAYFGNNWQAKMQLQDFEILGNHDASYKTTPHIEFRSQQPLAWGNAVFDVYSELSKFITNDQSKPEAERYHIEAGFLYPIYKPAWFLNSEVKLLQTHYSQEEIPLGSDLDKSVNRTLPKVRIHGGINFDRTMEMESGTYSQSLEPQLQYLYIPDKDQSNIGVYDTTTLQDDYDGLFRDRRFSGLDRIAKANQYSWGITSRIINPKNIETFSLSIGRIVYINESNIKLANNDNISENKSALATELYLRLNDKWQFKGDIQYNTHTDTTSKSQSNIDYQFSKNQTIQLNHRYTRNVSGNSLEQVSLLTNVSIGRNWMLVGRLTEDIQKDRSVESYLGLQYSSCCWGIQLSYHRHINSDLEEPGFDEENRDAFDSGFKIEFVYNGKSGTQSASSIADMFNSSIFGYKRPYFLNN